MNYSRSVRTRSDIDFTSGRLRSCTQLASTCSTPPETRKDFDFDAAASDCDIMSLQDSLTYVDSQTGVYTPLQTSGEETPDSSSIFATGMSRRADTFNASMMSGAGYVHVTIADNPELNDSHENDTSQALFQCKQKVLRPYLRLLSVLGWHPIITRNASRGWVRLLNTAYPIFVATIIILGYIVQWALCYRRVPSYLDHVSRGNGSMANDSSYCRENLFSTYVIPDCLHGAAFLYSFYVIRWKENEHLVTLMERVFLQTSSSHSGWLSQPKLIRSLRLLLMFSVVWILLSMVSHILRVVALAYEHHRIGLLFEWFHASNKAHYAPVVFLLAGLSAMDVVNAIVMTNYAIQCQLLITHMRCTMLRTRQKLVSLQHAMKDICDEKQYLKTLNDKVSTAVSILLFNVASMLILRIFDVFEDPSALPVFTSASVMRSIALLILLALPLVQACRVTAAGARLDQLGNDISNRPFGFQDTPHEEIHMFMLYTSSLRFKCKLFGIPVHTSWLLSFVVLSCFSVLVSLQLKLMGPDFEF